MNRSLWLISYLLLLTASGSINATSASRQGWFEGVTSVSLDVVIGGGLGIGQADTGGALQLFQGKTARARAFRESLPVSLSKRLGACGLSFDEPHDAELAVSLYGRPLEGASTENMFLVQVWLFKSEEGTGSSDCTPPPFATALGTADDRDLEGALTDALLGMLTTELGCTEAVGEAAVVGQSDRK